MKKKREKLFCDVLTDDNISWFEKIGKVADDEAVVMVAYPEIIRKLLNNGASPENIYPENITERAQRALLSDKNTTQFIKIIAVNNYYFSGRQVYKFDDTLSELLVEQSRSDLCISVEALNQLPISHFYIMRKSPNVPNSQGFFFSYTGDMIYIADVSERAENDRTYSLNVVNGKNISEIIEADFTAEFGKVAARKAEPELNKLYAKIAEYFQFVLYLSAINSEIMPVTKGAVVKRQSGQREYKQKDRSEISEVGYKVGASIRKSLESREKVVYIGEHAKGSPKSPHIRRSHFHSYWTGSGNDKELVVKWINTIFVHGNGEEQDTSTVHKVE